MTTETKSITQNSGTIETWRKYLYGMGDFFGAGGPLIIGLVYLVFLTDVMQISPRLAGSIFLVSKIYDAITDPFEGIISDRTRTKLGRRKPYLIIGVPFIILGFSLLFLPANFESEMARYWYAMGGYLFFSTIYSIVILNYHALTSEMIQNYDDRTQMRAITLIFTLLGMMVLMFVPIELIQRVPDINTAYLIAGIFSGVFCAIGIFCAAIAAKERPELSKRAPVKFNFKTDIIQPISNKSFLWWIGMIVFNMISNTARGAVSIYYMREFLGRVDEVNTVMLVMLPAMIISLPIGLKLSKTIGKKKTFVYSSLLTFLASCFFIFLAPGQPGWIIYVLNFVSGIFAGVANLVMFAMLPDIPDIDELGSGVRREGIYMSFQSLARKFADGIALYLVALAIDLGGYVQPLKEEIEGVSQLIYQTQPDSLIVILRVLYAVVPALCIFISMFCGYKYQMSPKIYQNLKTILENRRNGIDLTPEEESQASELKILLLGKKWK